MVDNRPEFRGPGRCEWCGRWFAVRDACHIYHRGMGGTNRLNFRINLVSMDRACHVLHGHKIAELAKIAARRERCTVEEIEMAVYQARRT